MAESKSKPLSWLISIYLMQGLPAGIVLHLAIVFYSQHGFSNLAATQLSSLLIVPWVLKIAFLPYIEKYYRLRSWILAMQVGLVLALLIVAYSIGHLYAFWFTLAGFLSLGFIGATQDAAIDGFYLACLTEQEQNVFVGVRTFCFHLAQVLIQSGFMFLLAYFMTEMKTSLAWQYAFAVLAFAVLLFMLYHYFVLPYDKLSEAKQAHESVSLGKLIDAFTSIRHFPLILLFLLFYEASHYQLQRILPLFFLADESSFGLGLTTIQFAKLHSFMGMLSLMLGALFVGGLVKLNAVRGWFESRYPETKEVALILPLACINMVVLIGYPVMAMCALPLWAIAVIHAIAQFIAGCMNSAYFLIIFHASRHSQFQTTMFALMTTCMLIAMILFGMFSGILQTWLGYLQFYWAIVLFAGLSTWISWLTIRRLEASL